MPHLQICDLPSHWLCKKDLLWKRPLRVLSYVTVALISNQIEVIYVSWRAMNGESHHLQDLLFHFERWFILFKYYTSAECLYENCGENWVMMLHYHYTETSQLISQNKIAHEKALSQTRVCLIARNFKQSLLWTENKLHEYHFEKQFVFLGIILFFPFSQKIDFFCFIFFTWWFKFYMLSFYFL